MAYGSYQKCNNFIIKSITISLFERNISTGFEDEFH